jgi:XapX domain-containing protein
MRSDTRGSDDENLLGFLLAFGIGAICRFAKIPSPAPNAILGSLLVVSMSFGYVTAGHYPHRTKNTVSSLPAPPEAVVAKVEIPTDAHSHQSAHYTVTHH